MVAIFDSPDFLTSTDQLKKFGFFKKIFYLILGFILGFIHKHCEGTIFTVLINFFLRKKVKLKYEKPFYLGVEGDLKFYFPNSESYYSGAISLPLFHNMTLEQQDEVVSNLGRILM